MTEHTSNKHHQTTPQLSKWKAIILSSQMQEPCPLSTCGVWKQDFKRSESLCPFMAGLFPWPLSSVACTVADYTPVTLRILCKSPNQIEIVDKTTFGRNVTEVRWPVPLFRFLVAKSSYLSLTGFFFPMTSFSL